MPMPRQGLENYRKLRRLGSRRQHQAPLTQARNVLLSNVNFCNYSPLIDAKISIKSATSWNGGFLNQTGIRARSIDVRPQASNVPEEAIKPASRLAARLVSRPQLLTTRQRLDIGVSC